MSASGEATVEPDGSTTFETPPPDTNDTFGGDDGADSGGFDETMGDNQEETMEAVKGIDPAMYLIVGAIVLVVIYFVFRRRKSSDGDDDFFSNLDGEKVRCDVQ